MHFLKTITTVILLISILPLCGLAAASAAARDVDGNIYFSDETATLQQADGAETGVTTPAKNKRIAILQPAQCGANALLVSDTDAPLFSSRNVQLLFGSKNFILRSAQAPPTSPPRSV